MVKIPKPPYRQILDFGDCRSAVGQCPNLGHFKRIIIYEKPTFDFCKNLG